jgi:DNA-binding transcriptional regulator GbsR (MarR family)
VNTVKVSSLERRREFIAHFASALIEIGFPRMPARVFAALLATDSGMLTSVEIAELLRVSAGAISGAVRYLTHINLIGRDTEPGTRRDRYRVFDDLWYEAITRRDQMLTRLEARLRDGIQVLGRETPAGERMAETLAFFEFIQREMPLLLGKWRHLKAELHPRRSAPPSAIPKAATRRSVRRLQQVH